MEEIFTTQTPTNKYKVEPHGKGFTIYVGRDSMHHGLNLGYLTECENGIPELIETALNFYINNK